MRLSLLLIILLSLSSLAQATEYVACSVSHGCCHTTGGACQTSDGLMLAVSSADPQCQGGQSMKASDSTGSYEYTCLAPTQTSCWGQVLAVSAGNMPLTQLVVNPLTTGEYRVQASGAQPCTTVNRTCYTPGGTAKVVITPKDGACASSGPSIMWTSMIGNSWATTCLVPASSGYYQAFAFLNAAQNTQQLSSCPLGAGAGA